jgi:EmrB/QacA subfamily drug resistance transporter
MRPNLRAVGIYLIGVFIGALDTNVLGPAFRSLMHAFAVPLGWVAWTITAYTVAYVAATVLAGAIGDRHGRRRMFQLGLVLFGFASLLAASAPNFVVFLIARAIQGAGAGIVYPNAQAEGIGRFPPERRGMALGLFAAVFGLASIVGPVVGGALAEYVGWPSIFLVNVPIVLVALFATRRLPESHTGERALPDWQGGVAFAVFLAAVLLAIEVGGDARLPLLVLAALALAAFAVRQRRVATPFLDTRALANPSGAAMIVGAALIGLNMSAAVFVPTLAQESLRFTAFASGLSLLPAAFTGAILAGVGGVLVDRIGPRSVLQAGLLAGVGGGLLLAWPHLTFGRFLLAMVAFGLATAFTMGAPLNRMALALYREDQAGEALSLVAVFRSVGLAAGPVLLTAAQTLRGFTGMFGAVALASLIGFALFWGVPDVRPPARVRAGAGRV